MMIDGYSPWPREFADLYRETGCWSGETFGGLLRERAALHPERIAVVCGSRRWTYGELDVRVDSLAAGLYRLGIGKGDRVVVQLPNVAEFVETIFALFRIGALPVFALPSHRGSEISYFCRFAEAKAYVTVDKWNGYDYRVLAEQVKSEAPTLAHVLIAGDPGPFAALDLQRASPVPLEGPAADDVAFLQLSGGSTGLPKLIPRTHDDYIYSLRMSAEVCALTADSVYMAALPAAHNFPLSSPGVLGTLYAGGRVVFAPSPSPEVAFPLIARERVTITALVPPLALVWLEAAGGRDDDLSSLCVLQVGGARLSEEAAQRVRPALGCVLQQVYGMAEGLVYYTRLDDEPALIASTQGKPMSPYDELRIVDEQEREVAAGEIGELLTRGPYTIRGYYRAEAHNARAFTADGFYRTGDLVRLTPDGYLVVEGRAKDQINRGGEKVAAEEVEDHLRAHPDVFDAAVVAMPDPFLGERTCAFLVTRGEGPTLRELRALMRARGAADYKLPDRVERIEALPKTAVGKIDKKELRRRLAEQRTDSVRV